MADTVTPAPAVWSRLPADLVRSVLGFLSSADRSIDLARELGLAPHALPRGLVARVEGLFSVPARLFGRVTHLAPPPGSPRWWDRWSYQIVWRWDPVWRRYHVWTRTTFSQIEWGPWEHASYPFVYPLYLMHAALSRHGTLTREKTWTRSFR